MSKLKLYFDYFKSKLKRRKEEKKTTIDPDEIKEEIWVADFSKEVQARFIEENDEDKKTFFESTSNNGLIENQNGKSFVLELKRKSIYSWAMNPMFRYHNFVLEAEIEFEFESCTQNNKNENTEKAGSCAAGFLFRHISQKAFYAFFISDKGWVRLDALVNNNPMPIIGWTKPLTETNLSKYKIKLICVGTSITILINNAWFGRFESDVVQAAGKIAFAGQNWDTKPNAKFYLNSLKIISKPILVEEADSAANDEGGISPEAYINLANTYYAMGQFVAAIYQLKQAWKLREPEIQDHILAGKIYSAQNLIEEAEKEFLSVLEIENDNFLGQLELAQLYYKIDKLKELKKLLKEIPSKKFKESSILSTLRAHLLSSDQKHEEAAKYYKQAFDLAPTAGILKYNEAKELAFSEKKEEAINGYVVAGNLFLAKEEYNDLANVINALEHLDVDNEELWALRGKFYYGINNKIEALNNFEKLVNAKTKDASTWYLYGLLIQNENLSEAIRAYKKAHKIEPDYALYSFRLAEALYLNDEDCKDVLEKAKKADAKNGWIYNLKGLLAIDEDNFKLAEKEMLQARNYLPDEIVILENYIEVKRLQGKLNECTHLFEIEKGTADLAVEKNRADGFHIFANALFYDEQYDEADLWYQKALKLKPFSVEILTDKAENSLEIGYLNDADSLLVKALDIEPSERIYRLISLVATEKGNYPRAEIVLKEAIDKFGKTEELLFDLANLYIHTNKKDKVKDILKQLKHCEDKETLQELQSRLKGI